MGPVPQRGVVQSNQQPREAVGAGHPAAPPPGAVIAVRPAGLAPVMQPYGESPPPPPLISNVEAARLAQANSRQPHESVGRHFVSPTSPPLATRHIVRQGPPPGGFRPTPPLTTSPLMRSDSLRGRRLLVAPPPGPGPAIPPAREAVRREADR